MAASSTDVGCSTSPTTNHARLRRLSRFQPLTVPKPGFSNSCGICRRHKHSFSVVKKMPVRSTHLSLRRRCPVFDVAGAVDATSVSSLLQPTDQADACVCPRSCRHSPPCSVGFRHSSRHSVNKRRFHRVARRRIRLQRHRGNLAWLPCVSSSPPHWLRF